MEHRGTRQNMTQHDSPNIAQTLHSTAVQMGYPQGSQFREYNPNTTVQRTATRDIRVRGRTGPRRTRTEPRRHQT